MKTIIISVVLLLAAQLPTCAQTFWVRSSDTNQSWEATTNLHQYLSFLSRCYRETGNTNRLPTNGVFRIQLQKDRATRGISVYWQIGTVLADDAAFSPTTGRIALSDLEHLLPNYATNGGKQYVSLTTTRLDKDPTIPVADGLCLLDVRVSPNASTNPIPKEIQQRFDLPPPYTLNLWIRGDSVFIDLKEVPDTKPAERDASSKR